MIHKIEIPDLFDDSFGVMRHANASVDLTQEGLENLRDVTLQLFRHLFRRKSYRKVHIVSSNTPRGVQTAYEMSDIFQSINIDAQKYIRDSLENTLIDQTISEFLIAGEFTIFISHAPAINTYFGDKIHTFENCEFFCNFAHIRSRVHRPSGKEFKQLKKSLLYKFEKQRPESEFDRFEKQLARDIGVGMMTEYPRMLRKKQTDYKEDFLKKVEIALNQFER